MSGIPEPKVRPVILAVDDEREDLELVERELRKRYEADYGVACEGSAEAGLERLWYFEASEQDVAVVLAALRKPGMSAVGFLVRVHDAFPLAKRLLLLDPMDRESRALLPRAMALGLIDYFESMITGESMTVTKREGDEVIGATMNASGSFRFEATKVGKDTALSQITRLVEEAQGFKAPIQRIADGISGVFVPAVMGVAAATFALWWAFGPAPSFTFALLNMVAVLIIACPCAMGLATPTSIMVGTGKGAESGILIKGGEALEAAQKLDTVVLDKTGTLTSGVPELTDVVVGDGIGDVELLRLVASAEHGSEHSLGEAIVRGAKERGLSFFEVEGFEAVSGGGVRASVEGKEVL